MHIYDESLQQRTVEEYRNVDRWIDRYTTTDTDVYRVYYTVYTYNKVIWLAI